MIKQNRERAESIPNYNIPDSGAQYKYSGMPKHLQDIYHDIKKNKEESLN